MSLKTIGRFHVVPPNFILNILLTRVKRNFLLISEIQLKGEFKIFHDAFSPTMHSLLQSKLLLFLCLLIFTSIISIYFETIKTCPGWIILEVN